MNIPKGQILWLTKYDGKGKEQWAITSDLTRTKWTLYDVSKDKPVKVKTGKSPEDFVEDIGRV